MKVKITIEFSERPQDMPTDFEERVNSLFSSAVKNNLLVIDRCSNRFSYNLSFKDGMSSSGRDVESLMVKGILTLVGELEVLQ